jgi:D-beta-D-heptose 7-phosphate kinase/D-beta-D-heptose 1-phosphate adenosyltransferase
MNKDRAKEILSLFAAKRIVVIGDVMLDEYIWGEVNRISPEAPVLVVDAKRHSHVPGGAANVANNIRALGAASAILGTIGDDEAGQNLLDSLNSRGVGATGLVLADDRPTTRKTRIIAHSQQVVRVDHEKRSPISDSLLDQLMERLSQLASIADGIVLSDYEKGVITPSIIDECVRIAKERKIPLTGNLKPRTISEKCSLTVLTLNRLEAGVAVGASSLDTDSDVYAAGKKLLENTQGENVLITLGSQGLILFSAAYPDAPYHVPAVPVEVYDVAGAGDTVISVLTLSLAAGAAPGEAVHLANHAASEVVKKVAVATVSTDEVLASF